MAGNDPSQTRQEIYEDKLHDEITEEVEAKVMQEAKEYLNKPGDTGAWQERIDGLDVYDVCWRLSALVVTGDMMGARKYIHDLVTEYEIDKRFEAERYE